MLLSNHWGDEGFGVGGSFGINADENLLAGGKPIFINLVAAYKKLVVADVSVAGELAVITAHGLNAFVAMEGNADFNAACFFGGVVNYHHVFFILNIGEITDKKRMMRNIGFDARNNIVGAEGRVASKGLVNKLGAIANKVVEDIAVGFGEISLKLAKVIIALIFVPHLINRCVAVVYAMNPLIKIIPTDSRRTAGDRGHHLPTQGVVIGVAIVEMANGEQNVAEGNLVSERSFAIISKAIEMVGEALSARLHGGIKIIA